MQSIHSNCTCKRDRQLVGVCVKWLVSYITYLLQNSVWVVSIFTVRHCLSFCSHVHICFPMIQKSIFGWLFSKSKRLTLSRRSVFSPLANIGHSFQNDIAYASYFGNNIHTMCEPSLWMSCTTALYVFGHVNTGTYIMIDMIMLRFWILRVYLICKRKNTKMSVYKSNRCVAGVVDTVNLS